MIRNHVEFLVEQTLKDLLRKKPTLFNCTCEQCLDDIQAITLNHVKPFYTACKIGEVYGEYNNKKLQNRVEIATEMSHAIGIVNEHPRHENT